MRSVLLVLLLLLSALSAFAQPKPAPTLLTGSYAGEALIVEQSDTSFHYNADGTGEQQIHLRIKVQSEAGARQFSVLSVAYAAATQGARFENIRVIHPDGTYLETAASDAVDMPAPVTQQAPLYSDLKMLQLPVRGLRSGDTLEYRVSIKRKNAESPSQFWDSFYFAKNVVVLAQTLTLDVPDGKYVQVWSPTVKPSVSVNGGRRIYHWTGSQLKPTTVDPKKAEPVAAAIDNKPAAAWTTFHSWQEVGDWYRALSAPRAAATDALRAQAEEITHDAKTPEAQVQAVYSFVATHIRYVGIDFGIGRYEPHAAAEVLANQYGDCKDKDTLLEALLHAKGFTTAPALIGVNVDMVPELPSPGLFNHVITTVKLPSGEIWMDSTPELEPFRLLVRPLRDKQALVIPASGAVSLERTPAQPPFPFLDQFQATATLKADGELNGHVDINDRSDSEIILRTIARNVAPAQWDQGTQYLANLLGFSGTTSNSQFAHADDLSIPMHVSYDYTRKPFGDWATFRIVPLFPTITLPEAPDELPSAEIDLGSLRTDIAISSIRTPPGFGADLPDAIHEKTKFATFDKTYTFTAGELVAKRTVVVLQSKLPAASWKDYKKFADDVLLGQETFIQLISPSANDGAQPPKAGENNPAAAQLIAQVAALEGHSDWAAALKKLDEVKAIQPAQPYLWSNYGFIAARQNKAEDAKKDFRHELDLHPDESFVVLYYANYLHWRQEDQEALTLLRASFNSHPSDATLAIALALIQSESSLPDAIATLRRGVAASPDNHGISIALASYLIRDKQKEEAAAILKKELSQADDPGSLNDASYLLSQTGSDLSLAEQAARKALDKLDSQSGQAAIGEANTQSFQQSALLVATWDTLGYILLQENRVEDARNYLEAAWGNRQAAAVGAHYGEALEKLGKPAAALRVYELTPVPSASGPPSAEVQQIEDGIQRLKKKGIKSTVNGDAAKTLQDMRSFPLVLPAAQPAYAFAIYRLQFSATAPLDVLRVGGAPSLDSAAGAIRQLHLPTLVPVHSGARILRDAVVTCSAGQKKCYFVLMPMGSIDAENASN